MTGALVILNAVKDPRILRADPQNDSLRVYDDDK